MGEATGALLLIWLAILAVIAIAKPEVMKGIWVVMIALMALSAILSPLIRFVF